MQRLVNGIEWEVSRLDTFLLPMMVQGHELEEGQKYVFTIREVKRPYYNREELGGIIFQKHIVNVENKDGNSYFAIYANKTDAYSMKAGRYAWDLALVDETTGQEEELQGPTRFEVMEVLR